jgi:hypothetical protein
VSCCVQPKYTVSHRQSASLMTLVSTAPTTTAAPITKEESPKHDLPAQNETQENHKTVPMPVITPVSAKDPAKDRSLEGGATATDAGARPIDADPAVSAAQATQKRDVPSVAAGAIPGGEAVADPKAKEVNQDLKGANLGESGIAPPTPTKDTPASGAATTTPHPAAATATAPAVSPATPAKTHPAAINGTPASITSTAASTPAKLGHGKEPTAGSDVRKRKSSFFGKVGTTQALRDRLG